MQEKEENIERFAPQSDKAENAFIPSNRVWVFRRGIGLDKTEVDTPQCNCNILFLSFLDACSSLSVSTTTGLFHV
jgi:hypothetical protein